MKLLNIFSPQAPNETDRDAIQPPVVAQHQEEEPLPITKDTNLGELAAEYPHLAEVLAEDYGLHCIGCFASSFDTLEMGASVHGMTEEDVDEMVKRLKKKHKQYLEKSKKS